MRKRMMRNLTVEEFKLLRESGYPEKAIRLYADRINVGVISDADVTETHTGPCGDVIRLYLKVSKNNIIEEAKFHYLGCPGSAASASAMIDLIKGKTIDAARKISGDDILNALGGLPKPKLDCPKLTITALQKALAKYQKQKAQRKLEQAQPRELKPSRVRR
jgi:nitrogen fixation NifU-like protein